MDKFSVKNLGTGEVRYETCRYQDTTNLGPRDEPQQDVSSIKHSERMSYYCISIPTESPWAKEIYGREAPLACNPSSSDAQNRSKRARDDEEQVAPEVNQIGNVEMESNGMEVDMAENKRAKSTTDNAGPSTASLNATANGISLNLPVPNAKGHAVIVKLYNVAEGTFRVNETVEFVGIVSLSPVLANISDDMDTQDIISQFNQPEMKVKNPPPSLIPRLHVLKYTKLTHNNPLLPMELDMANVAEKSEGLRQSRQELHAMLTLLLFGDALAAD